MVKALLTFFDQIYKKNYFVGCVILGHEILVFWPGRAENQNLRLSYLFFVILWTITLQNSHFWRPSLDFDFFHLKNGLVPIWPECPWVPRVHPGQDQLLGQGLRYSGDSCLKVLTDLSKKKDFSPKTIKCLI